MQKKVLGFVPAPQGHWVGDGFPGRQLSPFLLLDYAGPAQFEPAAPATVDARVDAEA